MRVHVCECVWIVVDECERVRVDARVWMCVNVCVKLCVEVV